MEKEELEGSLDREGLAAASRRGIAINYSVQVLKFGLQFIYSVAIARLLNPEDFGLVAMAAPAIAFAAILADLGLSQAVIQRERITSAQLTFLFWTNLAFTGLLCLLLAATAGLVGTFYNEPRVAPILIALSALMLVGAFSTQHAAILNRRLAFGTLAAVDLVSFVLAAGASLVAAWMGYGFWSIVINQAVIATVGLVLLWAIVPWRPGLPRAEVGGRSLLFFGGNIAISNIANFFARNIDNVLIGRFWGERPLGLYDRAYKLLLLPLNQVMAPIARVALPLLSRVQSDEAAYKQAYFAMLELALLLTYPASLFALITHRQLIEIVLGPQWVNAAPIFAILGIGALFAPISHSTGWLLTSQGRTREVRNYGVVSSIGFAIAIVCGLPWGATGVAASYIMFGVVQGPVVWWLTTRSGPVDTAAFIRGLLPYVLASLPVVGVLMLLSPALSHGATGLVALFVIAYVSFLLMLLLQESSRRNLAFLVSQFERLTNTKFPMAHKRQGV